MKITKNLKYAEFEWDEETKSFMITEEDGNRVILNKVYAFAFMRFVVRMAQRNWLRNQKKPNKQIEDAPETIEGAEPDDPSQLTFCDYSSEPF
jgi:hypothetical protein